jgi:LysM repeat protein
MIIMAIILGSGGFLALSYLRNRPDAPPGQEAVTVNGAQVLVAFNPDRMVEIVGPAALAEQGEGAAQPPAQQPAPEQPAVTAVPATPLPPTATPLPPTATPAPEKVIFEAYTVQPNDSLYEIARRIDVSIALMAQHGLSNEDLTPGRQIQLPKGNPAYCPGYRPYAVGEGDTAFSIGRRFNTTAGELQRINNLDQNYTVRVADIICVP